jgi:DNA-binding GntR family transcriptional regulator
MTDELQHSIFSGSPPASKEEFAYQTLREAIISGQLRPGTNLVQTDLSGQLGVSTIPIRSAIRRLAAEGLVALESNRPPTVSILSPEELDEILLIRMHLEILAGEMSFPRLTETDIEELWEFVREMETALERGELHLYGSLNKKFHLRMYEVSQCSMLTQMITDLWDNTDRHGSRSIFVLVPELAQKSNEEHHELLRLLEEKQFDLACELLDNHKTSSRKRLLEVLEERRE